MAQAGQSQSLSSRHIFLITRDDALLPGAKPPGINLPTVPCWHQIPLPSGSSRSTVAFCSRHWPGLRHVEPVGGWDTRALWLVASLSTAAAQRTDGSLQSNLEAAAVLNVGRALGIPNYPF